MKKALLTLISLALSSQVFADIGPSPGDGIDRGPKGNEPTCAIYSYKTDSIDTTMLTPKTYGLNEEQKSYLFRQKGWKVYSLFRVDATLRGLFIYMDEQFDAEPRFVLKYRSYPGRTITLDSTYSLLTLPNCAQIKELLNK